MYIFTSENQVQDLFINGTQAGSMCVNDTIMQYAGKILDGKRFVAGFLGFFLPSLAFTEFFFGSFNKNHFLLLNAAVFSFTVVWRFVANFKNFWTSRISLEFHWNISLDFKRNSEQAEASRS